jgi:predicted ATPase
MFGALQRTDPRCKNQKPVSAEDAQALKELDLACPWRAQGKSQQARELAPVCGWFKEGFDTCDLKDGKVLLEELA